jgi:gliding motility associated protien GldN
MKNLVQKPLLLFFLLVWGGSIFAQSNILDGVYIKEHTDERKVVPYAHLREADVMWSKRVWRYIDLKEKLNHDLYFPKDSTPGRISLMQLIWGSVLENKLQAYEHILGGAEGEFTREINSSGLVGKYNKIDTAYVDDPETGEQKPVPTKRVFNTSDVIGFKVKEDWFFDRQRSVMDVRIIGLAPVYETEDKSGEKRRETMFWIYFPEVRMIFANYEVFNRSNDAERRTFDDIFWKRKFSSYIYKESNVYERKISEYKSSLDALLEADKIKEDIFVFEHDLWEY